jgi:hypothetical protein
MIYVPDPVGAVGVVSIANIALDQTEQTAVVGPNQSGFVTFTGNVHCEISNESTAQKVIMYLEANAGGWPWTIRPSVVAFDKEKSDEVFSVSIGIPPGTSHAITQQLTIGARVGSPCGQQTQVFPANAMINVKQYYKFKVECDKPYVEVSPGAECIFTIKFTNKGNDQDVIKLMIDRESDRILEQKGWAVMVSCTEYIVDEGQQIETRITVIPPREWTLYLHELTSIKLRFYSFQAITLGCGPIERTLNLHIHEKGGFPFNDPISYIVSFFIFSVIFLIAFIFIKILKSRKGRRGRKPPHNVK